MSLWRVKKGGELGVIQPTTLSDIGDRQAFDNNWRVSFLAHLKTGKRYEVGKITKNCLDVQFCRANI